VTRWVVILGIVIAGGVGVWLLSERELPTAGEVAPLSSIASTDSPQPARDQKQSPASEAAERAAARTPSSAATTGTLRGRLIDAATRRPVAQEFEVRLVRVRYESQSREEAPVTQTFQSEDGRFAWQPAPAGTWRVSVTAHGYQPFDAGILSIVAGSKGREIVMPLRIGYTVRGRVFDRHTGEGIGEASIWAHRTEDGEEGPHAEAKSKQDGTFELEGSPGGEVTLSAGRKGYVFRQVEIFVGAETWPQEIALSGGGRIAGVVTTAAGMPVKGRIMLLGNMMYAGESNDAGQFSFEHLAPGQYDVSVSTPAGGAKMHIELQDEERKEDIVVALGEGRSVRGIVRGLRPEQLAGAFISLHSLAQRGLFFHAKPDEQGRYVLNGLPAGRAQLSAYADPGRNVFKTIEIRSDQDLTLDIVFPQGARLSGVVMQEGTPVQRTDVWLEAVDKQHESYSAWTSADGRYEIEGIAFGEYRIQTRESVARNITVSGDTVLNIDIPSVQLGGLVVEDGSEVPIIGATVDVRGTEVETSAIDAHKSTDQFGRFKLTGLEPGDMLFTVFKPGYEMYRERIVYDTPVADKTVRLRKTTGVEVRAHSDRGEPLRLLGVAEVIPGNEREINLQIPLDREGMGFLPSALAGSTLRIYGSGPNPIVVRQWDGHSLDLKF